MYFVHKRWFLGSFVRTGTALVILLCLWRRIYMVLFWRGSFPLVKGMFAHFMVRWGSCQRHVHLVLWYEVQDIWCFVYLKMHVKELWVVLLNCSVYERIWVWSLVSSLPAKGIKSVSHSLNECPAKMTCNWQWQLDRFVSVYSSFQFHQTETSKYRNPILLSVVFALVVKVDVSS